MRGWRDGKRRGFRGGTVPIALIAIQFSRVGGGGGGSPAQGQVGGTGDK